MFKRSEWLDGFQRIFKGTKDFVLRVDDLKKRLPKLRAKLSRMDDLESIWNWSFDFCKVRSLFAPWSAPRDCLELPQRD